MGKFSFFTENFSLSNDFEKLEMAFILCKNKLQIWQWRQKNGIRNVVGPENVKMKEACNIWDIREAGNTLINPNNEEDYIN